MSSKQTCLRLPLRKKHKREIRQLMLAAAHYLEVASLMGAGIDNSRHGTNAKSFYRGASPTNDERRRLFASAHLSSAALRFHTVEEILDRYDRATRGYETAKKYFADNPGKTNNRSDLKRKAKDWIHVMLRHHVCHDEDNLAKRAKGRDAVKVNRRRKDRRKCLARMKIRMAYDTLVEVHNRLLGKLRYKLDCPID